MENFDWARIRPLRGSQQGGFEELCCQLAAAEGNKGERFTRIGAPDAGVECVWTDARGSVRGWQAKFFTTPPTPGQWQQIRKSVETALGKYEKLVEYTICLPLDRPHARLDGSKSMMDQWKERARTWKEGAATTHPRLEFKYWGQHEIITRLAQEEHVGKQFYWFNTEALTDSWFHERFQEMKANVGARYTPELHVELEISRTFDGLSRNVAFGERIRAIRSATRQTCEALQTAWSSHVEAGAGRALELNSVNSSFLEVSKLLAQLNRLSEVLPGTPGDSLELTKLSDIARDIANKASVLDERLHDVEQQKVERRGDVPGVAKASPAHLAPDVLRTLRREARRASEATYGYYEALTDVASEAASKATLLVVGEAGTGKTHLFCDVVERATSSGAPAVLVLGEQFTKDDPWSQLLKQLHLSQLTPAEFLGALSAAAQASGQRALLLIDALNEGAGRELWSRQLGGFLAFVARYPWLGIGLSVRGSYLRAVVPAEVELLVPQVVHRGFAENEIKATNRYFDAHGIERPNAPVLTPEFSNPLFLKLFCKGLQNRGLTSAPSGLEGITSVFAFFLDSVNARLAVPERLDYDNRSMLVSAAIDVLAFEMLCTGDTWITRARAQTLTEALLAPRGGFERSLLRSLLSEGVLAEELIWGDANTNEDAIRFTYERLSDHRMAALLLKGFDKALASLADSVRDKCCSQWSVKVDELWENDPTAWYYQGLIEALAIQVPEQHSREIWELWPKARESVPAQEAFLGSLLWRKQDAIGERAVAFVSANIRRLDELGERLRATVLSLAVRQGNPLNAVYLHRTLQAEAMHERDQWWSTYVAQSNSGASPQSRLIDWAWNGKTSASTDETAFLAAVALAWFLTAPNREVRDKATKALVSLLEVRAGVLARVLREFRLVNDPYVSERVYAVAYGCVLRRRLGKGDCVSLAEIAHQQVFTPGGFAPNLLLRDYARGIVEYAAAGGGLTNGQLDSARPPYGSMPPDEPPSEAKLSAEYYDLSQPGSDESYYDIWDSVMGNGDFARYIIGTNWSAFDWTSRPLYGPHERTKRSQYDDFFASLSTEHQELWRQIHWTSMSRALAKSKSGKLDAGVARSESPAESFRSKLDPITRERFDGVHGWETEAHNPFPFDLGVAQRWVFQRVVELGWTPRRFNWFDRHVAGTGRMEHRTERIGKKYQWIAWREFQARVADNYEFKGERWPEADNQYQGPWQLTYARDIDPSYLRTGSPRQVSRHSDWWTPNQPPTDWRAITSDVDWAGNTTDLPRLSSIVSVREPRTEREFLWLRGDISWREPMAPEDDAAGLQRRYIKLWISAYVVRKVNLKQLLRIAAARDLWNDRLHENASSHRLFLGEYHWAPGFYDLFGRGMAEPWFKLWTKEPTRVLAPAMGYLWESNIYDHSIESTVSHFLPSAEFVRTKRDPGLKNWRVSLKDAVVFNPSLSYSGTDTLLVRADWAQELLEEKECDLVWFMTGEKLVLGGPIGGDDKDWARLEFAECGHFDGGEWRGSRTAFLNRGPDSRSRVRF
jgi:hypothetical protein